MRWRGTKTGLETKTSNLFLCQPSFVRKSSTSKSFLLDVREASAGSQTRRERQNAQVTSKRYSRTDLRGSRSAGIAQPTPSLLKEKLSGCLLSATFAARRSASSSSDIHSQHPGKQCGFGQSRSQGSFIPYMLWGQSL